MRSKALIVIALCLLGSTFALAQDEEGGGGGRGRGGRGRGNQPPPPAPETTAPDIAGVVAGGTKVQLVKEGFTDAQGMVAAPDGSVLFTERSANKITKVDRDGNLTTYMENTRAANGISFDPKGRLIGVRYGDAPGVAVLAPAPSVLSSKFGNDGYGHPKDLVVDKKGGVYFADQAGIFADGIQPGVFYVTPDGKTLKVANDIQRPSGVALSPDEKSLYVSDALGTRIKVMDVQPDGTVKNERNFVEMFDRMPTHSMADGMTVDAVGRLYVATFRGVVVISPEGKLLGRIPIPRQPLNIAFAGADKKTLYVLGGEMGLRDAAAIPEFGSLYKIPMLAEGYKGRSR